MRHSIYNKILETASDLFYANGYDATSLADIAGKCGCTKQALSYHFGSKEALGQEVCMHYIDTLSSCFFKIVSGRKSGEIRPDLAMGAAYLLWSGVIFYSQDAKALRFYREFIYKNPDLSTLQGNVFQMYRSFFHQFSCEESEAYIEMYACRALYASSGLLFRYLNGGLHCTQEEFLRFYLKVFLSDLMPDEGQQEELYQEAMALIESHSFHILSNYHVI